MNKLFGRYVCFVVMLIILGVVRSREEHSANYDLPATVSLNVMEEMVEWMLGTSYNYPSEVEPAGEFSQSVFDIQVQKSEITHLLQELHLEGPTGEILDGLDGLTGFKDDDFRSLLTFLHALKEFQAGNIIRMTKGSEGDDLFFKITLQSASIFALSNLLTYFDDHLNPRNWELRVIELSLVDGKIIKQVESHWRVFRNYVSVEPDESLNERFG